MRIGEYIAFLEVALRERRRVLGVGPVGVGKTAAVEQAAKHLNADCFSICTPLCGPEFFMGYPYRDNGTASHAPFGILARALKAEKPTVIHFDELGAASESAMKAALRLFQFGEVGEKRLPDCVTLVASSNDVGHGAGITGMLEPLKTRFHTIVKVEANLEDTIVYGLSNGWHPGLLAYLRNAPDALHDWKPSKSMSVDGATPRGWEYVSDWLNLGVKDPEVIAGCVGKGRAAQALAFLDLQAELPDIDGILLDPDGSPVPENPSACWLVCMALASRMNGENFGRIVKYANRLKQMFRCFAILDGYHAEMAKRKAGNLPKGYQAISGSRDFTAWAVSKEGQEITATYGGKR